MKDEIIAGDALEEEYEPDLIALEDEDGHEHTFEVLDATDIDGVRYFAMVPYHEDAAKRLADDAEMLIMRIGEEDGEEYLDLVEDEDELYVAGQVFLQRLSDVFDIDLDDLQKQVENDDK